MKRFIFDLMTSPFSLFKNPFYNYVAMAVIGFIAFKIAFDIVGELGLRGSAGSIVHWTIRLIAFVFIWFICCVGISLVKFVINHLIIITISTISILIIYILNKNKKKIYKRIFKKTF